MLEQNYFGKYFIVHGFFTYLHGYVALGLASKISKFQHKVLPRFGPLAISDSWVYCQLGYHIQNECIYHNPLAWSTSYIVIYSNMGNNIVPRLFAWVRSFIGNNLNMILSAINFGDSQEATL